LEKTKKQNKIKSSLGYVLKIVFLFFSHFWHVMEKIAYASQNAINGATLTPLKEVRKLGSFKHLLSKGFLIIIFEEFRCKSL